MKSILSELYEGNIFPAEKYSPRSEEYRKIHRKCLVSGWTPKLSTYPCFIINIIPQKCQKSQ